MKAKSKATTFHCFHSFVFICSFSFPSFFSFGERRTLLFHTSNLPSSQVGGYEEDVVGFVGVLLLIIKLLVGLVLFAILVGFITDAVMTTMTSIIEGKSKVAEANHTLILGWNETTIRVVCQIAFLRRVWRIQNETWTRRLFPWTRVPPSSPKAFFIFNFLLLVS